MAATDPFRNVAGSRQDSPRKAFTPTLSDVNELPFVTRAVSFEVQGDIKVVMADDDTPVVLPGLVAGVLHPLCVRQIYSTGTAASGIRCYY